MTTHLELAHELESQLPEVMAEWTAFSAEEPWLALAPEDRLDTLPEAVGALARWALKAPESEAARRRALELAALHGRTRRRQGYEDVLLFREYHAMREALWRFLRRAAGDATAAIGAMLTLDRALTYVTRAALLGYHAEELEARGEWPDRLEELCADAALPAPG